MAVSNRTAAVNLSVTANCDKAVLINPEVPYQLQGLPPHVLNPSKEMKFLHNYNGKLWLNFFTTVRLDSDHWQVGEYYKIIKDGTQCFRGLVIEKRSLLLEHLPAITAYMDTGLDLLQTQELLKKTYHQHDLQKEKLAVLLVQNIEWLKPN